MNQPESTLEEVEEAFSNWRYNRRGKEGIPDSLWEQVKILLKSYSRFELMRRLKLTTHQFREQGLIPIKQDDSGELSPSFVRIPLAQPDSTVLEKKVDPHHQLTIQRGEIQIVLERPSDEQIHFIITTLLR